MFFFDRAVLKMSTDTGTYGILDAIGNLAICDQNAPALSCCSLALGHLYEILCHLLQINSK